uniref:Uncharacterized protein n=1 Tax=Arundo donax TaxID=35708 RepID=A0A0A9FRJ8_ARUDO
MSVHISKFSQQFPGIGVLVPP